jgi:hypothetical protein
MILVMVCLLSDAGSLTQPSRGLVPWALRTCDDSPAPHCISTINARTLQENHHGSGGVRGISSRQLLGFWIGVMITQIKQITQKRALRKYPQSVAAGNPRSVMFKLYDVD